MYKGRWLFLFPLLSLDSVYVAGADLSGTDIEERAKCIERSNKMLNLVDDAVATMRQKHKTVNYITGYSISTAFPHRNILRRKRSRRHWIMPDTLCVGKR